MAEDVQGLIVLTEGDRFVTIGRAGRARVWRIDLSGEPVDDVDRTGAAPDLVALHTDPGAGHMIDVDHIGRGARARCLCTWEAEADTTELAWIIGDEHLHSLGWHRA